MNNVNVSVFSPIARQNLVEVNHINTFDKDITLTFTATESSTQFYITKGWSVASVTPLESITLDYLYIQEHESQQMEINCEVLNSTITYLLNTGVNMADSNIARNSLNNSFKRNLSYAAYQQAITSCANTPGVNTLAEGGVEFEEVKGGYRFGFNGQEKDNEVVGYGNVYDLGLRQYDARLGRMFSIDPRGGEYPWQSPYAYHRNNPMNWIDYLGGGDPPASDQITGLLGQAEQENAKGKQLKDMGDAKIIESIKLLDQASAMLNGQVSNADLTKALNLTEQALALSTEAAKLYSESAAHYKKGEEYYNQALGLVPKMMEEHFAELDKLQAWGAEAKTNAVIGAVAKTFGIDGLIGVGVIETFGPTIPKNPAMRSFPGTSRWSKYVAAKFPMNAGTKIPGVGGASITRGIGRVAVPLMLMWQTFDSAKSIHALYQSYDDGPTEEEIQFYLNDFETWKKENPE